ncbi:MAG: 30S ribosomal protein S8 [Planctomycetes bacterium]|nr:30S ribosomal protein S8 [Planctomycetota bacterium]
MASSDPLGDMIAMIKNANARRHLKVGLPHSRVKEGLARVLKAEGFLSDVQVVVPDERRPWRKMMWLYLKYDTDRRPVLTDIRRISTPGRRIYRGASEFGKVLDGLGVAVITTSKGILSDRQARQAKVGGELICKVW